MNQPLALVFYESLLPGTQLVNRLQDLGYRVLTASDPAQLLANAIAEKPMLVFADLKSRNLNVAEAIAQLRQNPATSHLPVIAFASEKNRTRRMPRARRVRPSSSMIRRSSRTCNNSWIKPCNWIKYFPLN